MPDRKPRPNPNAPKTDDDSYLHVDAKPEFERQFAFKPKKHIPASSPSGNRDVYKTLLLRNMTKLVMALAGMGLALFLSTKVMEVLWSRDRPAVQPDGRHELEDTFADDVIEGGPLDESATSTQPFPEPKRARRAEELVAQGRELQRAGDAKQALQVYAQARHLWADVPHIDYLMGRAHLDLADYIAAESRLRHALRKTEDRAPVKDMLGLALWRQGNRDAGYRLFREALDEDPGLASAQYHVGMAQLSRGQLEEAKVLLEAYRRQHPTDVKALRQLAMLAAAERRQQDALDLLTEAIRIAPDEGDLYIDAAATSALMQKHTLAIKLLRRAESLTSPVNVYRTYRQNAFRKLRETEAGRVYEVDLIRRAREHHVADFDQADPRGVAP